MVAGVEHDSHTTVRAILHSIWRRLQTLAKRPRRPLTEADVVEGYRLVLGREPESAEAVSLHRHGYHSCDEFMRALLTSEEFDSRITAAAGEGLSEADVVEGYRLVLGREPESAVAVSLHRNGFRSREELWRALLGSPEFERRTSGWDADEVIVRGRHAAIQPQIHTSKDNWLVVFGCQSTGLANSLRALAPGLGIDAIDSSSPAALKESFDGLDLARYDRVIVADLYINEGFLPDVAIDADRLRTIPLFRFGAFHPDIVPLRTSDSGIVLGPLGSYHSFLLLAAHAAGRSVSSAVSLFTSETFEQLGYLDGWQEARNRMINGYADAGIDIAPFFSAWCAVPEPFMHTPNHPKIRVLFDLAKALLDSEQVSWTDPGFVPVDSLAANVVVSVYPEIARELGVRGGYFFKNGRTGAPWNLEEFVRRSFACFDGLSSTPAVFATSVAMSRLDLQATSASLARS